MKKVKITGIVLIVLVGIFFLGPRENVPPLNLSLQDSLPSDLKLLETYIQTRESAEKDLKPDNEARILWANPDSVSQTEYAFVYLHGFSASHAEGNGLYPELAKRYKANTYLPRMHAHGTERAENMLEFDIEKYWQSAQEALIIGRKLGKKVVLVGTSTGGSLALMLASQYDDIEAIMLYSPNIDLDNKTSEILRMPWGLQLARLVSGGKYHTYDATPESKKYWQIQYRLEALMRVKLMLHEFMTVETFSKVTEPVYLGYYYKNEEERDKTVSVPKMLEMFEELGTPKNQKQKDAFAEAGEHVMTWTETAKDLENIKTESFKFLDEVIFKKKN